jgi:hypothetical protein
MYPRRKKIGCFFKNHGRFQVMTTIETNKGGIPLEEASLQQLREYGQTLEQVGAGVAGGRYSLFFYFD